MDNPAMPSMLVHVSPENIRGLDVNQLTAQADDKDNCIRWDRVQCSRARLLVHSQWCRLNAFDRVSRHCRGEYHSDDERSCHQ